MREEKFRNHHRHVSIICQAIYTFHHSFYLFIHIENIYIVQAHFKLLLLIYKRINNGKWNKEEKRMVQY